MIMTARDGLGLGTSKRADTNSILQDSHFEARPPAAIDVSWLAPATKTGKADVTRRVEPTKQFE